MSPTSHTDKKQSVGAANGQSDIYVSLPELLALRVAASTIDLKKLKLTSSYLSGESRSISRGCGIEFDEVRPYQAGDDIRCIDWRVSARTGKPLTKLFREEREHAVYIAVDQRPTMFFGSESVFKSVCATQIAAIIGWSAVQSGDRCGGVIFGKKLHSFRGARTRQSMLRMLEALCKHNNKLTANSQSSVTLCDCIDNCQLHARTGATVFIISDFLDCDAAAMLKLRGLARRHSVVLVRVTDPVEATLPMRGPTGISNGLQAFVARINDKFRQRYIQDRQAWLEALMHGANKSGMVFVTLSTTDNALSLFSDTQRSHAKRAYARKRKQANST